MTPEPDTRAQLGAGLRELRRAAGLTGGAAARLAGISQSKLSKVERGALRGAPDDVGALCRVYRASPQQTADLIQMAEELRAERSEPRRVTLSRGAAAMQHRIRRIEESAELLRSYQPCMVIGLVQTEAYARLVFGVSSAGPDVDRAVAARMKRQQALRKRVTRAVLIMPEGALRWQAGNPQVMIEQLEAIDDASRLPNVRIGIIPYSVPMAVFPRHGWHLYDGDAAIVGLENGTATITDEEDIARYEKLFESLEAAALFGDAARAVLAGIADDYRRLQRRRPPGHRRG